MHEKVQYIIIKTISKQICTNATCDINTIYHICDANPVCLCISNFPKVPQACLTSSCIYIDHGDKVDLRGTTQ